MIRRQSPLSINNNLLLYKLALKPICRHLTLGYSFTSNFEILERLQSKVLHIIINDDFDSFPITLLHEIYKSPYYKILNCIFSSIVDHKTLSY